MLNNWILMFIIALVLASMVAIFARTALAGLSGPQTVLISALTVLVISFTTLSFTGFWKSAKHFSSGSVRDIVIAGALLAVGFICLCMALGMAEALSMAQFYYLVPVFAFVANIFFSKKLPGIVIIIINIMIAVGVLVMGFGIRHKHGLWWIPALLAPAILAVERLYVEKHPLGDLEEVAAYFVVVIVAFIMSLFIRHKDLKKITAYHVFFAILTGVAFYYAPICYHRALKLCTFDAWLTLIYNLWMVFTVVWAMIFLREKASAGTYSGLGLIVAAFIVRFIIRYYI